MNIFNVRLCLLFVFCVVFLPICAQTNLNKIVNKKNEVWNQAHLNVRISNKWSIHSDVGYRAIDFFDRSLLYLVRAGAVYYFTDNIFLVTGMAYFKTYPSKNTSQSLKIPEIRPYQRLFINSVRGRFQISQRYRLEERFFRRNNMDTLLDSYRFNYRLGYQINIQFPFRGEKITPKSVYGVFYDELLINFGKQITYNHFDQNRVFLGVGYQINRASTIMLGYQYIWQQTSIGNQFFSTQSARITYLYNIDLRKQEE